MLKSSRDWHWLLLASLIVVLAMFGVYGRLHYQLRVLEQAGNDEATASVSGKYFNRETAARYEQELQQREASFNSLLNSPEKIADPSS